MKKILMSLILALCTVVAGAQVKVLGKIEPNGATDTYPTHTDSLGRGGLMAVGTWQERNSIPRPRRKAGMLVRVKSATVDSTYTIGGNLTNADWIPFATGYATLSGSNLFTGTNNRFHWGIQISGNSGEGINFFNNANGTGIKLYRPTNNNYALGIKPEGSTFTGSLRLPNLTSDLVWTFPNSTGTLATVNDIPAPVDISGKANLTGGNSFTGTNIFDVLQPNRINSSNLYIGNKTPSTNFSWRMTQGSAGPTGSHLDYQISDGSNYSSRLLLHSGGVIIKKRLNLEKLDAADSSSTFYINRTNNYSRIGEIEVSKNVDGVLISTTRLQFNSDDTIGAIPSNPFVVKVPQTNGTLITMEQVLAMTTVQTDFYHGADISGTTVTIAASPSRYKKVYIYRSSDIGPNTIFKLPSNPVTGDLVEILEITNEGFPTDYIQVQNSVGSLIDNGRTRFMSYQWNGTTWISKGIE